MRSPISSAARSTSSPTSGARSTAARLAKALKSPGRLLDVQTTANGSGRVAAVTAIGANGESTTEGAKVRTALGLRSTWFTLGVVSLGPASAPALVVYGGVAQLT